MESKGTSNGREHTDIVKQFHDEAYLYVDQALSLEESGCGIQAITLYEKGLQQLEQGLSIPTDLPKCIGENWDTARLLQMKMRKSKEHVLWRLEALSRERGGAAAPPGYSEQYLEMPPSYEEACLEDNVPNASIEGVPGPSGKSDQKKSFFDLCSQMEPMEVDGMEFTQVPAEAKQIFSIGDGVQIFFVSSDGTVSAPTYPTALTVYKFSDGSVTPTGSRRPPAFLQVGDWVYPLHPGRMPVLHTSYGAYMLPDTNAQRPGSAVGILLADDVPQAMRDIFEHLMCELTAMRSEPIVDTTQKRLSTKISDGIVTGAEYVSKGVVIGAEKTSEYVRIGARKLRARMAPVHNPTHVDPRVQKGMQIAKDVSDVAVRVSGFVLSQLGRATMALGHQLAPHVRRHGARLISKAMGEENNPERANATVDGMLEVASGGLKGFSTVYMGLESAALILAKGIISETVQTVNYKYGPEAGHTTGTTLYAAGNFAMTANNISHMGVKAIAKRAAKDTGKALVEQHEEKGGMEKGNIVAINGEKK